MDAGILHSRLRTVSEQSEDDILAKSFHTMAELGQQVKHNPIRVAQRLLRIFGDETESMIIQYFPAMPEKRDLINNIRKQRRRYSDRQWSRWGRVRTY